MSRDVSADVMTRLQAGRLQGKASVSVTGKIFFSSLKDANRLQVHRATLAVGIGGSFDRGEAAVFKHEHLPLWKKDPSLLCSFVVERLIELNFIFTFML
jgi:hypothetical protein